MSDEQAGMDQVGRYWDSVAQGDEASGIPLDPALARTIHRVHGLTATPSAEARERVWRSVLANAEAAHAQGEGSASRTLMPNGRALDASIAGVPEAAPSGRQRWFLTQLATAALIVLTLVGSFMVFGPGRVSRQEEPPVFIPAIEATPAMPEATATSEAEAAPVAEFLWSSEGGPETPFGDPYFLTLGPDGNLWIPDGLNGRIQIFSPEGEFIESWGTPGDGEGKFDFRDSGYGFGAVAFAEDGSFYVADMGNDRVQKFGPDRTYLASWGGEGDRDGQFLAPLGIAIDHQDRVYVTDTDRNDVQVFDRDGAFLAKWGGFGSHEGQLRDPHAVSIDHDGNVWVADFGNGRVQQFTPDGAFVQAWNGVDNGGSQLVNPANIVFDEQGWMYVSEWQGHRVRVFAPDGEIIAMIGGFGSDDGEFQGPLGIAFDGTGRVFVTEDGNDRVQAFRLLPPLEPSEAEPAATPVADGGAIAEVVWETRGGPDLPLSYPGYLALDPEGNLWIPDSGNDRFQIFSPDGEFLEVWGEAGGGEGQFEFEADLFHSSSIAFAPDGSFYVVDSGNFRVQKFGPDRAFVTAWGEQGSGPGQFDLMNGIAVDGQGRVYVTDDGRGDVQVFDANGAFLMTIGERGFNDGQFMFSAGSAVAVDDAGNIWVSDSTNQRIQTFSPDGEFLSLLAGGPREDELQQPNQLAIDDEGRIFVASPHLRQVQIFAADGTYLGAIGTANPTAWAEGAIPSGEFLTPTGVALDGAGNIYVADYEDYRVQKFRLLPPFGAAADAAAPTAISTPTAPLSEVVWESGGGPGLPLTVPGSLAVDPAGNLWVTDVSHDRFQIFSPDGVFLEAWGGPGEGDGEFAFDVDMYPAGGIAFAPDGAFYVADAGNRRVQQFAPDRSFVAAWGGEGTGPGQLSRPSAIAVDGDGRVYVTDDERNVVQVFTADGAFLYVIGKPGSGDGQFLFSTGSGIFVDSAGVVWVAERTNRRIQSFSADGEPISVLSEGPNGSQLGQPGQLAVDQARRLFVTSSERDQMLVFASDGAFLGAMEAGDPGAEEVAFFGFPGGLALDGLGHVYISDFERERVAKFRLPQPLASAAPVTAAPAAVPAAASPALVGSSVEFVWATSGGPGAPFDDPTALAFAPDGNLWVPDGSNGRFQILTPDGEFVETWGTPGSGEGEFNFDLGGYDYGAIAWDGDGNIYVADSGNFRVQKFAPDRSFLLSWGERGDEDGQFQAVTNLVVDGDNRIYAIDNERSNIQIFDQEGTFLDSWGNQGIGDGEFLNPGGAAFDADSNLYVAEYLNYRVQILAPDGSPLGSWGSNGTGDGSFVNPTDVAIDAQGRAFVAGWGNHRVQIFTSDGAFLGAWGELGFGAGQFVNPQHLAVDDEGFVYVSDEGSDRVQKFRLLPPLAP